MISAKRIHWSDNDHYWGPFLYASDKYNNFALVLSSGHDEYPGCRLRMSAFGHTLIIVLPPIIRPYCIRHVANSWDATTVARLGRNWYEEEHEREYGFSYSKAGGVGGGGFLQVFLGPQTMDSSTTKSWTCFTPWNNWRHVRTSYYDLQGNHYYTEPKVEWKLLSDDESMAIRDNIYLMRNSCPTRTFSFTDFDGETLTAKTKIEEREWRLGEGLFKWLSWFRNPIIQRSLNLDFSGETGRKKGSWKGGTTGHSISMLPSELHESAFRRYCAKHEMVFVGEV